MKEEILILSTNNKSIYLSFLIYIFSFSGLGLGKVVEPCGGCYILLFSVCFVLCVFFIYHKS